MRPLIAGFALALLASPASAQNWVGTWGSSQIRPSAEQVLTPEQARDTTIRQIVRVSIGGKRLRVRFSNAFGATPLTIAGAHVALSAGPGSPALKAGSDRALTFSGAAGIIIPAGADYWSDPVDLPVTPLADLAISTRFGELPAQQTGHPGARGRNWIATGNALADPAFAGATPVERWFHLAGVEVDAPARTHAVVAFGDSITDGYGVKPDSNTRWTDALARRMATTATTRHLAMLNQGIGGNCMIVECLGPNALARFDRDVLSHPGVSHVVLLEGVNDLGGLTRERPATAEQHRAFVARMISGYTQFVARARAAGIKAIGATVMPYTGSDYYHPDAANEADRQAVNAWIRTPGNFDAVIDFDAAMRDPGHPERLRPGYDSGDHLHPSAAGYQAMADAVPLSVFTR